jgi:hypothetical protein
MSVLIFDKETNKHVMVSTGKTNTKKAPSFSGNGRNQEPLSFIEEFDKAAKWNNWKDDECKKETFLLCLSGNAERWYKMKQMTNVTAFKALTFEDNEQEEGLLTQFENHYITEEWYEYYTKHYEERTQLEQETPLEYMDLKRYLFQRAGKE